MFPSNSNGNNDPIAYIDHSSIPNRHISTDISPYNYKQEDHLPLSFFHFPSPYSYNQYEFELENHDFFLQHHHDLSLHQKILMTENSVSETIINMPADSSKNEDDSTVDCSKRSHNNATNQQVLRKRSSSKKDRHSKINTANGPRDRRMRLSLDVARDFFGLQDMLGYDKASSTVEWLLTQAKAEIKKLARSQKQQLSQMNNSSSVAAAAKSPSSTSEAEVVSGIDKAAMEGRICKGRPSTKEKKVRQPRKTTFRPLARDLREKARERAKARTKAKIMWTQRFDESKLCDDHTRNSNNDLNKFSSWSSFETAEESGNQDHNRHNNPSLQGGENISIHGDMVHESLAIMNKWSPDSIFSCLQSAGINQEHQLTGFVSYGKPWEAYNNKNL